MSTEGATVGEPEGLLGRSASIARESSTILLRYGMIAVLILMVIVVVRSLSIRAFLTGATSSTWFFSGLPSA